MLMAPECDCENIRVFRNLATDPQTEKPDHDQIQDLGAAAVLSMMMATPLFGQAAIQEPGAFAFYHPNADVLNGGRPTPAASGALASAPLGASDAYAAMGSNANGSSCAQRYRSYDPASGTFLGYDGHRHPCE